MTPAEQATANAISFECKKDALQQRQSGDWKISFTVQGVDMDERITRAAMGTRFVAVLVEIGDDEQPVKAATQAVKTSTAAPAGAKRPWEEWQPQQQAGMRCNDPIFISFLKEQRADDWHETRDATECVRLICGVHSRVELGTNQRARVAWHQLDEQYLAWKALEHA